MGRTQYETIQHTDEEDALMGSPVVSDSTHLAGLTRSCLVVGVLCLVAVTATVTYGVASRNNNTQMMTPQQQESMMMSSKDIPMVAEAHARACTFDECYASNCNHEVAPYTCLFNNGGPHGGCSPTPWIEGTCDESCDLSGCASLPIPSDAKTCKGKKCTAEWCEGGQVCPSDVPYQCMDGSARYGCSMDEHAWTFESSYTTCSECCDISTCE